MFELFLPKKQKTLKVYQVVAYWEGEGGSWEHGWYESAPFVNKADAEKFQQAVKKEWMKNNCDYDPATLETPEPEVVEYDVLAEYAPPGNGDNYLPKTWQKHVCCED